jgi:NAD(P)-dependent dehydrogenase (short-subunit alcohol dehydrogenase family)
MYPDLKGKIALVTGAGKRTGIGYAIALELARNGTHVIVSDLGRDPGTANESPVKTGTEEDLEAVAADLHQQCGVDSLAVGADLTSTSAVAGLVEEIRAHYDHVDILCNNAGASFGVPNAVHTYDESAWMKTIDVNLHSVFRVSKALVPLMTGRKASIINTASRAAKVPALFNGAYAVAKAGVVMLTKVMALELAGAGIRVNAVCPGQISTDLETWRFDLEAQFFDSTIEERRNAMCQTIPLGRIGAPSEVASLVAYLASEQASYTTGQAINVTGGQLMEV